MQVVLQARRSQGVRELQQCHQRFKDVQRQLALQQVLLHIPMVPPRVCNYSKQLIVLTTCVLFNGHGARLPACLPVCT